MLSVYLQICSRSTVLLSFENLSARFLVLLATFRAFLDFFHHKQTVSIPDIF